MRFFGREDIIRQLMDLWGKGTSSLVTCRGRRRIGKSTLIEKFSDDSHSRFIKIEGLKPTKVTTDADERRTFAEQLAMQSEAESSCPENWLDAFNRLAKEIRDDERTVVLLDEVSWMAQFDGNFASTLKIAWDNYLKRHDRLVFVACGDFGGLGRRVFAEYAADPRGILSAYAQRTINHQEGERKNERTR